MNRRPKTWVLVWILANAVAEIVAIICASVAAYDGLWPKATFWLLFSFYFLFCQALAARPPEWTQ